MGWVEGWLEPGKAITSLSQYVERGVEEWGGNWGRIKSISSAILASGGGGVTIKLL